MQVLYKPKVQTTRCTTDRIAVWQPSWFSAEGVLWLLEKRTEGEDREKIMYLYVYMYTRSNATMTSDYHFIDLLWVEFESNFDFEG